MVNGFQVGRVVYNEGIFLLVNDIDKNIFTLPHGILSKI